MPLLRSAPPHAQVHGTGAWGSHGERPIALGIDDESRGRGSDRRGGAVVSVGKHPRILAESPLLPAQALIRPAEEHEILDRSTSGSLSAPKQPAGSVTLDDIRFLQQMVDRVYVDAAVKRYIIDLVFTTRGSGPRPVPNLPQSVRVGASPRGSLALMRVGQAHALLNGRDYVTPDDVRAMRYGVLRHRLVLTFDALASGIKPEQIIDAVFHAVPMP